MTRGRPDDADRLRTNSAAPTSAPGGSAERKEANVGIKCDLFGWHEFYASDIEMDHVVDDTYRATMVCRKCGMMQCALIRVPIPPWIEQQKKAEKDAVPVVRCADCKQWDEDGSYMGRGWCGYQMKSTGPRYFCADGEKDGGEADE